MAEPGTMPRVLLDRYELRHQVGVGGMGEVWIGWDRRLQRDVAVKLLLPQLSAEPAFRQRFEVEARAAAALEHPNVVRVFDIDDDAGSLFIVMERLPGPSLDRRIYDEGSLAEDEVVRIAADMLAGLSAAHAENLVHRDIKPGNLIRSAGGRWKVGDFGVAKDLASTAHLTLVGVAVGTPAYLAPEQLDGRPATPTTDLWAAGVVLREALTGRRPFEGNDPIEVAHAVQHTVVPPLATVRPDVSPALGAAIDRSLSFDSRQRFATAQDMLDAIEGKRPTAIPLLPVEAVPAPPPSVGGEVAAPIGPAVVAAAAAPAASVSGERPGLDPTGPPPPGPDRSVRAVAITALVAGTLLVLLLLGVMFGLLMLGRDSDADVDEGGDPAPIETTTEPTGAPDEETPASSTTTGSQGLLPGDGPISGGSPATGSAPSTTTPTAPGQEPKPGQTLPETTMPGTGDLGEGAFGASATLGR